MPTDCIEWTKYRQKFGYGVTRFKGKTMLAHRVAWIKSFGDIPEGMNVLHKCDNPSCVNIEHLFLGTQFENIMDCKAKGRISRKPRNTGAAHGNSKITEQTAIRLKKLRGVIPCRMLGDALSMDYRSVWEIQTGKNWKHVTANTRYGI